MAKVQSLEICQTSEEGLAPSSLLEQSCEDLASEMSSPSLSRLRSPDSTEEDVMWPSSQPAASLANAPEVCTDVPLHQSEVPSAACEETLSDLIAGCFPELFLLSDQTRDIKPVDTSNFYSGHQEAKHGHAQSIPTSPSISDPHPYLPKAPSDMFPSPHQPYVTYHLTPHCLALVLDVTRANTPHFICVPQPNHTSCQLNINYTPLEANHSCPMHQATPPYPFTPSSGFPSHLCVLNSNQPTNARRPSESLDTDQSWRAHVMTSSASLHKNFSVWQRFCEAAKEFYSRSPHVQALTCFFITKKRLECVFLLWESVGGKICLVRSIRHEIDSLTVLHSGSRFDAAVNMAVHKWDETSLSEREKYYTSAKMFIKLEEEERRFIQHRFQTNKPRGQHLGLWENPEVTNALEVKDRSEDGREIETMNTSSLFSKRQNTARERETVRQVTGNAPDGEKILKGVKRKPEPNMMDSDVLTAVRRAKGFTNHTKLHQTVRRHQQQVTRDIR